MQATAKCGNRVDDTERKETTMSNINEMFNAVENNETTSNARNLAGTAQLTSVAN